MDRRQRVLNRVRPAGRRGVEIGPLTRPIVLRGDGDILYADHLSREGLREKYAGHPIPGGIKAIVETDLVLDAGSMRDALGPRGPVDYILASHVFEHIPDPIGWLRDCADALREGGTLCLMVPDKRFTFDHHRTVTGVGDMVAAQIAGLRQPGLPTLYEYLARARPVDASAVWRGVAVAPVPDQENRASEALAVVRAAAATGHYIDAHCTTFTPWSFVAVMAEIAGLGLIPFAFEAVEPTRRGHDEFMAVLVKRSDLSPAERAASVPSLDPRRHHELPRPPLLARLRSAMLSALRPRRRTG